MAWYLLGYIILGIICIYGVAAVHLATADIRGYKALEWWTEEKGKRLRADTTKKDVIIGVLIWPIRLIEFINVIPDLYTLYERKDENES